MVRSLVVLLAALCVTGLGHARNEGVTADEIECGLTEKGGTVRFAYLLDANSADLVSRNRLEVTVTHVN